MKGSTRLIGLFLALMAGTALAGEPVQEIVLPQDAAIFQASSGAMPYLLAQNDGDSNAARNVASAAPSKPAEFKESWLTLNKTHEYLGVATLIAAGLTMLTAPSGCESEGGANNCANYQPPTNGTHAKLGRATRALALTAVATGIAAHWDDMHPFEDGLKDPDTQHWLLAGAGALILANAVSKAPAKSHSGQAELGAAAMLVAVKLVW